MRSQRLSSHRFERVWLEEERFPSAIWLVQCVLEYGPGDVAVACIQRRASRVLDCYEAFRDLHLKPSGSARGDNLSRHRGKTSALVLSLGAGPHIVGVRAMVDRKWGAVTEPGAIGYQRLDTLQKAEGPVLTGSDTQAAGSTLAHMRVGPVGSGKVVGEVDVAVPVAMEPGTSKDWRLPSPGTHFAEACEGADSLVLEGLVLPRTWVQKAGRMHADRLLMVALVDAHT